MSFKFAFAGAASLMVFSGATPALADIAPGQYLTKGTITTIGSGVLNGQICKGFGIVKGSVSYNYFGYIAASKGTPGSVQTISGSAGKYSVEAANVSGSAVVGSTETFNIYSESFVKGVLTAGTNPKPTATLKTTFKTATATTAGYKGTVNYVVTAQGYSCAFTSSLVWTKL